MATDAKPQRIAFRRLEEYQPLLSGEQFFSSASAAVYWGLPLPWAVQGGPVHVATQWPNRAPRVDGTIGHALRRPHVVERDGWRVQAPTDAWCELSTLLTLDELIAAGDALFYRQRKLTTRDRLANAIRKWGSKPGALLLREAFELIRENAESPKETEWRLILMRAGFPEPTISHEVRDANGELIAILDLAYEWAQTGLDYEGRHHADDPDQFARDGVRYNALQRAGWHDIRIMAGMAKADILDDLDERLTKKGWRRPDPPAPSRHTNRHSPPPGRHKSTPPVMETYKVDDLPGATTLGRHECTEGPHEACKSDDRVQTTARNQGEPRGRKRDISC
ncbi:hypothetical protein GCM10022287_00780 [Gryllotalpicola koreensis]|uniref:DUF559 domain-containing protein n=1 Tax=Gryllotalpicola koreensis TaxID=993086 RepID=A0ABP7ZPM9_9MICO